MVTLTSFMLVLQGKCMNVMRFNEVGNSKIKTIYSI